MFDRVQERCLMGLTLTPRTFRQLLLRIDYKLRHKYHWQDFGMEKFDHGECSHAGKYSHFYVLEFGFELDSYDFIFFLLAQRSFCGDFGETRFVECCGDSS